MEGIEEDIWTNGYGNYVPTLDSEPFINYKNEIPEIGCQIAGKKRECFWNDATSRKRLFCRI